MRKNLKNSTSGPGRQMKNYAFKREIKDEKTLSYTAIPRRWIFL